MMEFVIYGTVTLALLGGAFCVFAAIRTLYKAWPILDVTATNAINDDLTATKYFIDLLDEAKEKMTIYDDGDDMAESIYNNPEVIVAVQGKLDQNADFKIQCFFNFDHDLRFRQVFGNHPQVDIRTGDNVAANDVHYKIIDDGRKAYLSRHKLGASERRIRWIDCTKVRRDLKHVTDEVLGEYKRDIEQKFGPPNTATLTR